MAERVRRFDFHELRGKPRRTPQGFLRVDGHMTRVGVFPYRYPGGKIVREFRPPDEVFKEDSMATLRGAPVTDLHPSVMVDPANARSLSLGFVGEDVRKDGDKIAASQTIFDKLLIEAVERRDRCEVSLGYQCRIDATPGTFNGEPYDVVQRDIVYNHAALGPRNWGRMGKDVALKLDSDGKLELNDEDAYQDRLDDSGSPQPPLRSELPAKTEKKMETITIRIDGVDYEVQKASAPHISKALATRDEEIVKLRADKDKAEGRADAADKALADEKKKREEAEDPKRLDAGVSARFALIEQARKVLPTEHKFDGQSVRQIQESVLKKHDDKLDLSGKSDDYVQARFDSVIAEAGKGRTDRKDTREALNKATEGDDKNERKDDNKPETPAWKQPLAYSRN